MSGQSNQLEKEEKKVPKEVDKESPGPTRPKGLIKNSF